MIALVSISENATDAEIEEAAWQTFATLHPHEAFAANPDRFWTFFQTKCPTMPREQMEVLLTATEDHDA